MTYALGEITVEALRITEAGIELQCTSCGAKLGSLPFGRHLDALSFDCSHCPFSMRSENGIWQALRPVRGAHFFRFIEEYQNIRAAESRGSLEPEFYLNLPYKDLTGKNTWQWKIRARTCDFLIRKRLP